MTNLLDFLFPKHCVGCGSSGHYLCPACEGKIEFLILPICPACGHQVAKIGYHTRCHRNYLDGLIAVGRHRGPLKKLVKHLKYYGHSDMAKMACQFLTDALSGSAIDATSITFVPLHSSRERKRGYNQSALLAAALAKNLGLPRLGLLRKTKPTKPQAGLSRQERLKNLKGVFSTQNVTPGMRVILIDDVATTAATLNECARELKEAGASKVYGLVLAHGG